MPRSPEPPVPPPAAETQAESFANEAQVRYDAGPSALGGRVIGNLDGTPVVMTDEQAKRFQDQILGQQTNRLAADLARDRQILRKWCVEQALKLPLSQQQSADNTTAYLNYDYTSASQLVGDAETIYKWVTQQSDTPDEDSPF